MSRPELTLRDVSMRFGNRIAADNVSFDVASGEFVAILGPSGSGKSTLLKMLGGQLAPQSGEILLGGESIVGLPPNRIDCATVFQDYALFPHMTVQQNVEFGLRMRKWDGARRRERALESLELVGMRDFADRSVRQLSGGERQRVATARALAVRPRLLLMDEPLGALDRLIKLHVQQEVSALLHEMQMTTVYVTHDQREALVMADRVALMHNGRLEQIDDPVELVRNPANRFVAEFLGGSGNYLPGTVMGTARDGVVAVDCPLGTVAARAGRAETTAGADVTVHVRPEELAVGADPAGPCTVETVAYTGEIAEIQVRTPQSQLLTVKQLGISTLQAGEPVRLTAPDGLAVILSEKRATA